MKRIFAISFSLLLLVSHISVDLVTHFCSGEMAGIKIVLFGSAVDGQATNDEEDKDFTLLKSVDKSGCCHNKHKLVSLDENACLSKVVVDNKSKPLAFANAIIHTDYLVNSFQKLLRFHRIPLKYLLLIHDFQSFFQVFLI